METIHQDMGDRAAGRVTSKLDSIQKNQHEEKNLINEIYYLVEKIAPISPSKVSNGMPAEVRSNDREPSIYDRLSDVDVMARQTTEVLNVIISHLQEAL